MLSLSSCTFMTLCLLLAIINSSIDKFVSCADCQPTNLTHQLQHDLDSNFEFNDLKKAGIFSGRYKTRRNKRKRKKNEMSVSVVDTDEDKVCETLACLEAAHRLSRLVDLNLEPCQDFYEYSCGSKRSSSSNNFNSLNQSKQTGEVNFRLVDKEFDEHLHRLLITKSNPDDEQSIVLQPLKIFYESCLKSGALVALGQGRKLDDQLSDLIDDLGGWPIASSVRIGDSNVTSEQTRCLEQQDEQSRTSCFIERRRDKWIETLIGLREMGLEYEYLISLKVKSKSRRMRGQKILLVIDRPLGFESPHVNLLLDDNYNARQNYQNLIEERMRALGGGDRERDIREQAGEVLEFEVKLARIFGVQPTVEPQEFIELIALDELEKWVPNNNWSRLINELACIGHEQCTAKIPNELTQVAVWSLDQFKQLDKLLHESQAGVVLNYLIWRLVQTIDSYHGKTLDSTSISNTLEQRQSICLNFIRGGGGGGDDEKVSNRNSFALALAILYLQSSEQNNPNSSNLMEAKRLINQVRQSFSKLLDHTNWIDQKTRTRLTQHLHELNVILGYPNELQANQPTLSSGLIDLFYELNDKVSSTNSHLENIRSINKWSRDIEMRHLFESNFHQQNAWMRHSSLIATLNGHYDTCENSIQLGAGLLNFPNKINQKLPSYLKYSQLGMEMGRQLNNAFARFNYARDNLHLWPKSGRFHLNESAECFRRQYDQFNYGQIDDQLNGIRTLEEQLADFMGVKLAHLSYELERNHMSSPRMPRLPGLKQLSPDQLFWISLASEYCASAAQYSNELPSSTRSSSPLRFRVNGPLANSAAFAKAFKCPLGSPMNPINKCDILV